MSPIFSPGGHRRHGWQILFWWWLLLCAGLLPLQAVPTVSYNAASAEEFVGPFASWKSVKSSPYNAYGDGSHDDTAAIQHALNDLRTSTENGGGWSVLYFPAGTYKITSTLTAARTNGSDYSGIMLVGEDPTTTTLLYAGASEQNMLDFDGWYDKFSRLTFDGQNLANTGFNFTGASYSDCDCFSDCFFENLQYGIMLGSANSQGVSETTILRCRFINCSDAGVYTNNWNSMDEWVWDCLFQNCGYGCLNNMGDFHYLRYNEQRVDHYAQLVLRIVNR